MYHHPQITIEWIPVADRLPDDDRNVLITRRYRDGRRKVYDGSYDKYTEAWWECGDIMLDESDVLAWADLPAPYEP